MTNNKKKRRLDRKNRNRAKDESYKKIAWESGKLIEENHNNESYSLNYTIDLSLRLLELLKISLSEPHSFIASYRNYKNKIRDLIIYWSPEVEENNVYVILKLSLELYWDGDIDIIKKLSHEIGH